MKRWLVIGGLLLGVCHADLAVAASRSPSLLQRILAVFTPRPAAHHNVAAPNHQAGQKVEAAQVRPAQTAPLEVAQPVNAASAAEKPEPAPAEPPIVSARSVPAMPAERSPMPAPGVQTVRETKQDRAPLPARPVQAARAAETAQPVQAEPKVGTAQLAQAAQPAKDAKPIRSAQPPAAAPPPLAQAAEKAAPLPVARSEVKPKPDLIAQTIERAQPVKPALPLWAAAPVQAPQAMPTTQSVHSVAAIEIAPPVLRQTEPAPKAAQATQQIKEIKPVKPPPVQATRPIQTVQATETTQSVYTVASIEPAQRATAQPGQVAQSAGKIAPMPGAPSESKPKPDQAAQTAQAKPTKTARPVQVAILGAPNLKAALPQETTEPVEAPTDKPSMPPVRQERSSACNSGQRVVSAYYWEGRHTASGQPFNPQGMTAAHRTLPFGTRLNVTNPRTGKTVNVLINDRGPFVRGVSLDLSLGAAQAIGLHGTGSVCIL